MATTYRYLGNRKTTEVHDLHNEKSRCQISKIKTEHRRPFSTLRAALDAGYDRCAHCLGGSTR